MPTKHPRLPVTFTEKEYEQLKLLAQKNNLSMSEICREFVVQGLNGTISQQNIDFMTPIIREQLKGLLEPAVERLAAINAKTCVQAGAAAYLSAEAILRFVPEDRQEDVEEAYIAARKKAVRYMQGKADLS